MTSLAEVGVLYVYIMITLLIIGLGYVSFRGINNLINWLQQTEKNTSKVQQKSIDKPWIRLSFLSATFLFLAIFSLGVLKTLGGGEDEQNHNHQSATNYQMPMNVNYHNYNPQAIQQLQNEMNNLSYQILQMEAAFNRR